MTPQQFTREGTLRYVLYVYPLPACFPVRGCVRGSSFLLAVRCRFQDAWLPTRNRRVWAGRVVHALFVCASHEATRTTDLTQSEGAESNVKWRVLVGRTTWCQDEPVQQARSLPPCEGAYGDKGSVTHASSPTLDDVEHDSSTVPRRKKDAACQRGNTLCLPTRVPPSFSFFSSSFL